MKDSQSSSSPKKEEEISKPDYSNEEVAHLKFLQKRLENAKFQREQKWDELDGLTYSEYWEENERLANTYVYTPKNQDESQYQSGITRNKLFATFAPVLGLDLSPDISAYSENQLQIHAMGEVVEDAMHKVGELENDDEKKLLRQYELFKQGDVFVEDVWDQVFIKDKVLNKKFDGSIKGVTWTTRVKRILEAPKRSIISGKSVFLGDLRKYDITDQPYIFTYDVIPYAEAEAKYGEWERWKNVPKKKVSTISGDYGMVYNNWRLFDINQDEVEVIKYQDKWNNEFAVILNGVLMTPVGLPLPWGFPEYNIRQQGYEPIKHDFAYHGSLVKRLHHMVGLYDEMKRLSVLRAQKNFLPPYLNLSGRVVSRRVFYPGAITSSLQPGDLQPISQHESQPVGPGEFNFLNLMKSDINDATTDPIVDGRQPSGNPTAAEVNTVRMQAEKLQNLAIVCASMLEWKLGWLRLFLLLGNWWKPKGKSVKNDELVDDYRITNIERPIPGEGMGRRVAVPSETLPSPEEVKSLEDERKLETGVPHRFVFFKPNTLTDPRLTWQLVVTPKQKRTSDMAKLSYASMLNGVVQLTQLGASPNVEYLGERYSVMWNEDPQKMWNPPQPKPQQEAEINPAAPRPNPSTI